MYVPRSLEIRQGKPNTSHPHKSCSWGYYQRLFHRICIYPYLYNTRNMQGEPTILSIETSLDDTCAAVTIGPRVISNIVSSQTSYHASWGGTVPDIAKRLHQEWLPK